MAATFTTGMDPQTTGDPIFLTRREVAVLAAAVGLVVGALLLLVLASSQVASVLFGPG